jgi:hypothetical protein
VTDDNQSEKDTLQDPKHWRARAEEVRAKASAMASPELKERMLLIAVEYERLARLVEINPLYRRLSSGSDSL